jgi:uncharacterized membrane protein
MNNKDSENSKNELILIESRFALERITFFSDAVMAIAITLLIIEIVIPTVNPEILLSELTDLLPNFLSYIISFFIIGSFWIAHHRIFTYIKRYDSNLLWLNLLFLFFVSFLPFPTALLGEYASVPLIVIIYSMTISLLSFSLLLIWIYASRKFRLINEDIDLLIVKKIKIFNLIGPIGFLVSIPFAFLSVFAAFIVWWVTPIIGIIYRRIVKK